MVRMERISMSVYDTNGKQYRVKRSCLLFWCVGQLLGDKKELEVAAKMIALL